MKFSPKSRTKKLGMISPFWEAFAHLILCIGKGPIFGLKSGLGKSLMEDKLQCISSAEHIIKDER